MDPVKSAAKAPKKEKATKLIELDPRAVDVDSNRNPRRINEKSAAFVELVESVKARGVIVPIHVRPLAAAGDSRAGESGAGRYELLAGERRVRAAAAAGAAGVPAVDHGPISDAEAFDVTFAENFAREDLTPVEQGRAARIMIEQYNGDVEAAASKMGKSARWVRQRAALATKLSKRWLEALAGVDSWVLAWTASHLQLVAALPGEIQDELFDEAEYGYDVPSVKDLAKMITERFNYLSKAPWAKAKCRACGRRTSKQPGLWDDCADKETVKKNDRCMDAECWGRKMRAHLKEKFAEAKKDHPNIVPAVMPDERIDYSKRREISKDYGGACSEWKAAGQGDKGAVAAMIVAGPKAGDIRWIRPGPSRAGGNSGPAGGRTSGPKSLTERRAMLDKKRWNKLLDQLRDRIERKAVADLSLAHAGTGIAAMAALFGNCSIGDEFEAEPEEVIDRLLEPLPPGGRWAVALEYLWQSVKPTLRDKLRNPFGVTQTPEECIEFAKWIGPIVQVDIDGLFAEISETKGFTEPKAWANLKADGSPKARKTAKKKTAKTKT